MEGKVKLAFKYSTFWYLLCCFWIKKNRGHQESLCEFRVLPKLCVNKRKKVRIFLSCLDLAATFLWTWK